MAISSVSNAASQVAAMGLQQLKPNKDVDDKQALQAAAVKPAGAAPKVDEDSTLGTMVNTTA